MEDDRTLDLNLRSITGRIYRADDIDEALRAINEDVCALFAAERLTVYVVNEDRTLIVSKLKRASSRPRTSSCRCPHSSTLQVTWRFTGACSISGMPTMSRN